MMAITALVAWVLTASIGVYMLRTWVTRGGLLRQRATGIGVPPAVVFGHASAALVGLVIWAGFVTTKWDPLAWLGVVMITGAIALGVCTVTLWTPYPVVVPVEGRPHGDPGGRVPPKGGPGGGGGGEEAGGSGPPRSGVSPAGGMPPREDTVTDEMIASLLADPFPARRRLKLVPLIPVVHGFGALTTFMLAVLAAITRLGAF